MKLRYLYTVEYVTGLSSVPRELASGGEINTALREDWLAFASPDPEARISRIVLEIVPASDVNAPPQPEA